MRQHDEVGEPHPSLAVPGPVRRPPVRQATIVRSDVAHTFDTFIRTIGVWWPVRQFSPGGARVREVTVDARLGGRVWETWADGAMVEWGHLTAWSPPERFVMSWLVTPAPTEVEVVFRPLGPALTRVAVEHRGWEQLTEEQLSMPCGLPGGYAAGAYSVGWAYILACLASHADRDRAE